MRFTDYFGFKCQSLGFTKRNVFTYIYIYNIDPCIQILPYCCLVFPILSREDASLKLSLSMQGLRVSRLRARQLYRF